MEDLVRYRAMESLCRQSAVFRPLESWRLLAEAETWHHKALAEITNRSIECNEAPPAGALAHTAVLCNARDGSRLLAGLDCLPKPSTPATRSSLKTVGPGFPISEFTII